MRGESLCEIKNTMRSNEEVWEALYVKQAKQRHRSTRRETDFAQLRAQSCTESSGKCKQTE